MEQISVIRGSGIYKKYKGFELDVPQLNIPKGFATALIGENGAGKTTLLNILAGIRLDYKGEVNYFDSGAAIDDEGVRERIGFMGPGNYFLPHWTLSQIAKISQLLFDDFDEGCFSKLCEELGISKGADKEFQKLSDGNRMKLMLATVLARRTDCLIMDEPASPLDPLMREKLCDMIRAYMMDSDRSVFFSTHNIADMENVTDYAIIMEHGKIVEAGFVEDLKEKYVLVKGDAKDIPVAEKVLYTINKSRHGFEGICLSDAIEGLAGLDVIKETPTLSQISVAIMKANTGLKLG